MIDINLKGLIPLLVIMFALSIVGIWKIIEIVSWLCVHVKIV
jgi:hypothetical protein